MKLRYLIIPISIIFFAVIGFSNILKLKTSTPLQIQPGPSYENEWKKIDSLTHLGQPETALSMIDELYRKAKKEQNHTQIIKAIIYKTNHNWHQEDTEEKNILFIENELKSMSFPSKPMLQSILAEKYWNYYQNNRHVILQRSVTSAFDNEQIQTWDADKFISKVATLYIASLENADSLKRLHLSVMDSILITYEGSKIFRPTLYDFLMHRAIDFFAHEESGMTKPSNLFQIDNPEVFSEAKQFISLRVTATDSLSFDYKMLVLLRQLTAFRLEEKDINALVDLEMKRLKLMRQKAILPERDSFYLQALLKLESDFKNDSICAQIGFEIAQYYFEQFNKEYIAKPAQQKSQTENKQNWAVLALEKCNDIVDRFPQTRGAYNSGILKQQILSPAISLQVGNVNVPEKPFLSLVHYKNVDNLHLKIIRSDEQLNKLNDRYEQATFLAELNKRRPITEWQQRLPKTNDYRLHSVEIKINALPIGKYYLVASVDKEYKGDSTQVVFARFWVSQLSYINKNNYENPNIIELYVLDRTSGNPIPWAQVNTYAQRYNYATREYDVKQTGNYRTNAHGYVLIQGKSDYENFKIEIIHKNDKLDLNEYFHTSRFREEERPITRAFIFTDRAIYRPGQTVFFKGIVIETAKKESKIRSALPVTVTLRDANYQVVREEKFITSDYGTFNGNFILPSGGLNGTYTLQADNIGIKTFHVEDYKRPKFEVKFESVKGSYQLNDLVVVTGNANMYAGSPVGNALIRYRVVRNARYPIWWSSGWHSRFSSSPEQEIISGETTTDTEGNFSIRFTALPDFNIDKKLLPVFTYTVYADVTDISGETQSAQTSLSIGYVALEANLEFKETLLNNEAAHMKIITKNLNGEFEPAKGTITIHQLIAPHKLLRKKLWQQPTQHIISPDEYNKEFPIDEYDTKSEINQWKQGPQMLSRHFNTEEETELLLKELTTWEQGAYLATLKTQDKFGNEIKVEKYFTVINPSIKQMPYLTYDFFHAEKTTVEPGEKAKIIIGSAAKDVKVLYELTQHNTVISRQWFTLHQEKKIIEIAIEEKHRGNISVQLAFIKDNRLYAFSQLITVPFSNKELKVEWETFRDKLAPGQHDQWKLKISGPKGEKVAAELLASMYDASLDAFVTNQWHFSVWQAFHHGSPWTSNSNFRATSSLSVHKNIPKAEHQYQQYDELNWFNPYGYYAWSYTGKYGGFKTGPPAFMKEAAPAARSSVREEEAPAVAETITTPSNTNTQNNKTTEMPLASEEETGIYTNSTQITAFYQTPLRTNFQETAFFYPDLQTDAEGHVIIRFTMPDALSRWKFLGFAHTKELQSVLFQKDIVTQKDLMIFPNAPRFLRENDKIMFSAKVTNLSQNDLKGTAKLILLNALTLEPMNEELGNTKPEIAFEVKKGQSSPLTWSLKIPQGIEAVTYRISASASNFTDAEENTIPILTNRILVTETLPLWIKSNQTKTFKLEKLLASDKGSATLKNQKLTLEFTSQPAWYAIQALPYLMEYPYECAEQVFNRLYANALASSVLHSSPRIKLIFDRWKNTDALISHLTKNQELKNILLEETPWVLEAQNEAEQKKRIALLFDLNNMSQQIESNISKLEKMQLPNGGFPWFNGMIDNEYITLYILTGLSRLDKLNAIQLGENQRYKQIMIRATQYCDDRMKESYEDLKKRNIPLDEQQISYLQIQYLYTRSFVNRYVELPASHKEAYQYYLQQAEKYWNKQNPYMKGMIALALHRIGNNKTPPLIMRSLEETAIKHEELGMYWKDMTHSYYWYQAPIEAQSLLIEAFDEITKNQAVVDELRIWLLKHKQTNSWSNSKSTADACYALLVSGTQWLTTDALVDISVGNTKVIANGSFILREDKNIVEPGTGYFKISWNKKDILPAMGTVVVTKKDKGISWGALYWQYFEHLDKITPTATPLQLKKQLFLQESSIRGTHITPLTTTTQLKPGDLIKVRIELRVDRDMEFVHMKDMRASGLEPINTLSEYKWQGGLGYYESTRDAATHFFFDRLPKGTYVFEYPLGVSQKGEFSNGITTIQCMYAPEFASHSEGMRIRVE